LVGYSGQSSKQFDLSSINDTADIIGVFPAYSAGTPNVTSIRIGYDFGVDKINDDDFIHSLISKEFVSGNKKRAWIKGVNSRSVVLVVNIYNSDTQEPGCVEFMIVSLLFPFDHDLSAYKDNYFGNLIPNFAPYRISYTYKYPSPQSSFTKYKTALMADGFVYNGEGDMYLNETKYSNVRLEVYFSGDQSIRFNIAAKKKGIL
jgi:hypothetical protein